jgi:hypothetical protein
MPSLLALLYPVSMNAVISGHQRSTVMALFSRSYGEVASSSL